MQSRSFAKYLHHRELRYRLPDGFASKVDALPNCPGAYTLYDRWGELLYVGMSRDLRATVSAHLARSEDIQICPPSLDVPNATVSSSECSPATSAAQAASTASWSGTMSSARSGMNARRRASHPPAAGRANH
jgi:hypothetical protein